MSKRERDDFIYTISLIVPTIIDKFEKEDILSKVNFVKNLYYPDVKITDNKLNLVINDFSNELDYAEVILKYFR
jgi:hypothetical protein|tara:strand:+ start:819 stop:1040 length:222 start_codon:yes stop_codon:yes gene_type:complete